MNPKKLGRPRKDLTEAAKSAICREVSLGKSLRSILKAAGMPTMGKVMDTLQEDAAFAERYARARRSGMELHIDGIIDLADSATAENAQAVRLMVDTRKWLASKMIPRVYGDKLDVSTDSGSIMSISINLGDGKPAAAAFAERTTPALPAPILADDQGPDVEVIPAERGEYESESPDPGCFLFFPELQKGRKGK